MEPTILSFNKESPIIKYIYHISDLRIRDTIEFHKIYEEILYNLELELANEITNGIHERLIVITGNLFHSRHYFYQETCDIFDKFMEILTNFAPVIIIFGKYDSNVYNISERDNSSLKMFTDSNPLIYKLYSSGIYIYENLKFYVGNSIKTYMNINNHNKNFENEDLSDYKFLNIALFNGELTNNEYDISISDLEKFDASLLGGTFNYKKIGSNIAFAGPLFNQNFNSICNHYGFLKWEFEYDYDKTIISSNTEFIQVHNDNCYYTIIIPETGIIALDKNILPSNPRLRIFDKSYKNEIDVRKEIHHLFPNITNRPIYIKLITDEKSKILKEKYEKSLTLFDKLNFEKYIRYQLKDNEYLENVVKLWYEVYDGNLLNESSNYQNSYTIDKLEFKSAFNYSDDIQIVDFKKGVTSISGKNANGKTSILEILLFSIWGNSNKLDTPMDILNINHDAFYTKVYLTKNNHKYEIIRSGSIVNANNKKL